MVTHARELRTVTPDILPVAAAHLDMGPVFPDPISVTDFSAAPIASTPIVASPVAKVSAPRPAQVATPNIPNSPNVKDRPLNSSLTYDVGKKVSVSKWPVQSAIAVVILLSASMLLTLMGRSQQKQTVTPPALVSSADGASASVPADRTDETTASYDAAPEDTEQGQVLTVVAGPQQSLKDLSLRYAGHFDSDLSNKILSLNPDLKDPDHLEVGELIRIPLPAGAMKKVNDTAEATGASKPETSGNLFSRFTAFLHARK
jgi:hypothetical protein